MNSTKLARRTGLLAARAILGTATAKFQVVAVATGAGITALLFMFGMVAVAYQTATTAQASEIGQQDIPPVALLAYQQAAAGACDGLHWSILAGIGKVETDHGRHGGAQLLPNGDTTPLILGPVLDGSGVGGNRTPLPVGPWRGQWGLTTDYKQALGPMQFLPDTFAPYAPSPAATPHNIHDATRAAAAYLCDGGITDIGQAIRRYNNSQTYVDDVLHWAALYQTTAGIPTANAQALADYPNIHLTTAAKGDLETGIVDPRLIHLLATLAQNYQLDILSFRTGHPRCKVLPGGVKRRPQLQHQQPLERPSRPHHGHRPRQPTLQAVSTRNTSARAIRSPRPHAPRPAATPRRSRLTLGRLPPPRPLHQQPPPGPPTRRLPAEGSGISSDEGFRGLSEEDSICPGDFPSPATFCHGLWGWCLYQGPYTGACI